MADDADSRFSVGWAIRGRDRALAAPVLGRPPATASRTTPLPHLTIIDVELDGRDTVDRPLAALAPAVRGHLLWDLPLIALYGLGLLGGALLLRAVSQSSAGRGLARFGVFAGAVAIAADLVEDAALWSAFRGTPTAASSAGAFDVASTAAVIKFSALVPAALIALAGAGLTLGRVLGLALGRVFSRGVRASGQSVAAEHRCAAMPVLPDDELPDRPPAPQATAGRRRSGPMAARVQRACLRNCAPRRVHGHPTGICLSGGGIRAASVAMGALQAPEFRERVVPTARYLVSVSGGGYTAGAFQQALTAARSPGAVGPDETVLLSPETAFLPGTAEEDHVRRHSSYLAANPVELLLALALLARHLLLTLTLLFGPAVLLGVAAGLFYRAVPVTVLDPTAASATGTGASPGFPAPRASAWVALGLLVVLAVGAWLIASLASAHAGTPAWAATRRIAGWCRGRVRGSPWSRRCWCWRCRPSSGSPRGCCTAPGARRRSPDRWRASCSPTAPPSPPWRGGTARS